MLTITITDGSSFKQLAGKTLAGSGKTTLAMMLVKYLSAKGHIVQYENEFGRVCKVGDLDADLNIDAELKKEDVIIVRDNPGKIK